MGLVSSDENSLSLAPNIITKKVPAKQLSSDGEITSKPFDGKASGDSFMVCLIYTSNDGLNHTIS